MWYSGPHLGTPSDITLFEENQPPLSPNEQLFADKAYVKDEWNNILIAPIKNQKGCTVTEDQSAFNDIIAWYRASIEHAFGFLKRYIILSSIYRGRICNKNNNSALALSQIIKILIHSDAVYIRNHPHRTHLPIIKTSSCIDLAAKRTTLKKQPQIPKPLIIKKKSTPSKSSSSSSSSSSIIDTGCTYKHFEIGDAVMAWYNDDFYIATVLEKDSTNKLFTLVFDDLTESPDFEPREMKHLS